MRPRVQVLAVAGLQHVLLPQHVAAHAQVIAKALRHCSHRFGAAFCLPDKIKKSSARRKNP